MPQSIPRIEQVLPEFMSFVRKLATAYQNNNHRTWREVATSTQAFFTPDQIESMDAIIPGWKTMSSYANGEITFHIVCVFMALLNSPEYTAAPDNEKVLLEWSALLHDIAKESIEGQRDLTHAFRSAADAALILTSLGFETPMDDPSFVPGWITATKKAHISQNGIVIPDNAQLPEIISGIDTIFGKAQPGANIVEVILFHHSLKAEKDWPCTAPLPPEDIRNYLDAQLLRLLGTHMLADSASYNLFDHPTRKRYRAEILESLTNVAQIIETNP